MKNIKIKTLEDNSVKVRIEHSAKMTATVDELLKLSDSDFNNAIATAKNYRRANKKMSKFLDDQKLRIKIESSKELATIVNDMVDLGRDEFKKAISCAKQYRRANKMLDSAISKYVSLGKEDREGIRKGLEYEAVGI